MNQFPIFRITLVIAVFVSIISFPLINSEVLIFNDIENTENRKATDRPTFEPSRADHFPEAYDQYYNDQFPLRQRIVKTYNWVVFNIFKRSPLPNKVILGQDGWLFMAGTEYDCFDGSDQLTEKEMSNIKKELEYRKQYHEARGRKYYFMVAPVKANIYPELLPEGSAQQSTMGTGESLVTYLNKESCINVINMYDVLRRNKHRGQLYYKLDNHWNQKGGLVAAEYILLVMNTDRPEVKTIRYSDFVQNDSSTLTGNLENMLSNVGNTADSAIMLTPNNGFQSHESAKAGYPSPAKFPYTRDYENVRAKTGIHKPVLLIISDSFGGNLFPFISEGFGRSVKIFDAWQYKRNEDIIAKEKPDVVLVVVLESKLRLFGKKN